MRITIFKPVVRSLILPVWLVFCAATAGLAQGTYPKIEASFTVNTPIADPFDYSNDVRVLIVQPDTTTISLPAFFDGGTTWRVRHFRSITCNRLPGR